MIAVASVVLLGVVVPSPGGALLRATFDEHRLLLAASPDPEAEADLERDMKQARKRLGHDEGDAAEAKSNDAQQKQEDEAAEGDGADDHAENPAETKHVRHKRAKRHRRWPEGVDRPVVEGHAKGHYLAWGIVDWVVAGGLLGSTVGLGLMSWGSARLAKSINDSDPVPQPYKSHAQWRRGLRGASVVFGIGAVAALGIGTWIAFKARHNVRTFHELKEQERVILLKHAPST